MNTHTHTHTHTHILGRRANTISSGLFALVSRFGSLSLALSGHSATNQRAGNAIVPIRRRVQSQVDRVGAIFTFYCLILKKKANPRQHSIGTCFDLLCKIFDRSYTNQRAGLWRWFGLIFFWFSFKGLEKKWDSNFKKMKMASFLLRRCQFYSIAFQFHFHWKKTTREMVCVSRGRKTKKKNKQTPKKNKNKRKAGLRRRVTPGRRPNKDARWVRRRRDADPLRGADVRTTARRAASDDDDVYFRPLFFCFLFLLLFCGFSVGRFLGGRRKF